MARNLHFWPAFLTALIATSPLAFAQEKVTLGLKAKEGSFGRYSDETNLSLEAGGQKLAIVSKEVSKVTVMKVEKDGTITFEHKAESSEMSINGEKMPGDDKPSTNTRTVKPNGTLVSFKDDDTEPDEDHLGVRIWQAQAVFFPDKPVGVGDKWKHEYKADTKLGTRNAEADFALLAFEEVGGAKCAKIELSYREVGTSPAMASKVTVWVEIASGDVVQNEYTFDNVPFPGPTGSPTFAKATGSGKRLGGGPLPGTGPAVSAEPEPKKIEDVTKGFEKLEGVVTMYRKRDAGRQTIYMEVRKDQLGQLMMLQATASTGTAKQIVTGTPIGDIVFKFSELQPDKVTVVVPNFGYRADEGTETQKAVRRSFADSFIEQFNVEARSKERGSFLIDVSDLFRGDIARLSTVFQGGGGMMFGGGSSYSLDREKTFVSSVKTFPENLVVETVYNLAGSGAPTLEDLVGAGTGKGDPRSVSIKVVYNLFPLKTETGYVPRIFDPRVGFFTVWFQDFGQISRADQQIQYVTRWDVRKKDTSQAVSEPSKQIVFWLDNAIPKQYREPLKAGILCWNKAFEKIGIKNAIDVRQMPDDADWDPADMRFNLIRWVTSPSEAYAVSQPRFNPITGEIINGSILVDANLVRFIGLEQSVIVNPTQVFKRKASSFDSCRLVQEGMNKAWIGSIVATAPTTTNKISSDEYFRQFLQNVICHEFGHMLGLRHNFAASTELTLAQLGDPATVETEQPSASVMDYVPFNVSAVGKKGVDYYGRSLGAYDYWAIEYGYKPTGAKSPSAEAKELAAVASQCNQPGLAYQTDENADGFDPYVTRFDLSADPLGYWTKMSDLGKSLLGSLKVRRPANGESYFAFTRELISTINVQAQAAFEMTRFIGGLKRNGNFKGDPGESPTLAPLAADVQRKALDTVCKTGLAADSFSIPKSYLTMLTDNPNNNPVQSFLSDQNPFNVMDTLSSLQSGVMNALFAPDRLALIVNNEFKARPGSNPLQLREVFMKVQDAVWSELGTASPVTALRRQLQRHHIDRLVDYGVKNPQSVPSDARMWAWAGLRDLRTKLGDARKRTADPTTQVHFDECLMRIDRALNAQESVGSGGGRASLSDMMGGG